MPDQPVPVSLAPDSPASPAVLTRAAAFDALRFAVAGLLAASKPTLSAAVKPALLAGTNYRFNEAAFGMAGFREFLIAAQAAGAVALAPRPDGVDVEVLLVEGERNTPASGGRARVSPLRADLWQAFVDWSPGWARLWDRERELAVRFPEQPTEFEDPAHTQARALRDEQPGRFVPIPPVGVDVTVAWMAEFSDALAPGPVRGNLTGALTGPRPLRAWTAAVRDAGLYDHWHEARLRRLRGTVLGWAARNNVDLSKVPIGGPSGPGPATVPRPDDGLGSPTAAPVVQVPPEEAALRAWLHDLIDRVPGDELGSIQVPARHAATP